jgi:hypothetical protein
MDAFPDLIPELGTPVEIIEFSNIDTYRNPQNSDTLSFAFIPEHIRLAPT